MMLRSLPLLALASVMALAGCATSSPDVISRHDAQRMSTVIDATVLTVRNVTAMHAANDGYNIHGARIGIRLENVKAFSNGDEGISAHETVQMDVVDSEIAWNGSAVGGVADVNDSVTTYTNCVLHHNVNAAFLFDGKKHRVTNCTIHHQDKDIIIRSPDVVVEQSGVVWQK